MKLALVMVFCLVACAPSPSPPPVVFPVTAPTNSNAWCGHFRKVLPIKFTYAEDTIETINEARAVNEEYRKRCG